MNFSPHSFPVFLSVGVISFINISILYISWQDFLFCYSSLFPTNNENSGFCVLLPIALALILFQHFHSIFHVTMSVTFKAVLCNCLGLLYTVFLWNSSCLLSGLLLQGMTGMKSASLLSFKILGSTFVSWINNYLWWDLSGLLFMLVKFFYQRWWFSQE